MSGQLCPEIGQLCPDNYVPSQKIEWETSDLENNGENRKYKPLPDF